MYVITPAGALGGAYAIRPYPDGRQRADTHKMVPNGSAFGSLAPKMFSDGSAFGSLALEMVPNGSAFGSLALEMVPNGSAFGSLALEMVSTDSAFGSAAPIFFFRENCNKRRASASQ